MGPRRLLRRCDSACTSRDHALRLAWIRGSLGVNRDYFTMFFRSSRRQRLAVAILLTAVFSFLAQPPACLAQGLVISEFMAANDIALFDSDGDSSDWVEVTNTTNAPLDLDGWSLSDNPQQLRKWVFPPLELAARESLVVFASSKDRRAPGSELHTNFRLSGGGEFLALVEPNGSTIATEFRPEYPQQFAHASYGFPMQVDAVEALGSGQLSYFVPPNDDLGASWIDVGFDDTGWSSGAFPLGFDSKDTPTLVVNTDVGAEMLEASATAYVRIRFDVSDPAGLDALILNIKFDDGFVAYLNGQEVARRHAPLEPTADGAATTEAAENSALFFEPIDISTSIGSLQASGNVLALYALNRSLANPDFFIDAELHGLRLLGVDTSTPRYFEHPTPGWPNSSGAPGVVTEPQFSHVGAAISEPFFLEITAGDGDLIRFTTDRTEPTELSPLYEGPIRIDASMEVRARAFVAGMVPSRTVREVFAMLDADLVDFSSDLPIVVFSSFSGRIEPVEPGDGHLFIFERSGDGRTRLTQPTEFAGAGFMRSRGSSTALHPKKSWRLEIRDGRGNDLNTPVLGMPAESDWILYGAHQIDPSLMRNAFMYELSNQMGRYAVRGRFCEVFLTTVTKDVERADYVGVYSFFEKVKRDPERIDIEALRVDHNTEPEVSGGYILKFDRGGPDDRQIDAGGASPLVVYPESDVVTDAQIDWITAYIDSFAASFDLPGSLDPSLPVLQKPYADFIDVGSWIDHHLLQELSRNSDALSLSTFFYKDRGGKMVKGPIWDFDRAVGAASTGTSVPEGWQCNFAHSWWGQMFRDPLFWQTYKERYLELRTSSWRTANFAAILDQFETEVAEAQARNFDHWGHEVIDHGSWAGEIEYLRGWLADRTAWMDAQFISAPVFSTPPGLVAAGTEVNITVDDSLPGLNCEEFRDIVLPQQGEVYYTTNGADPRGADFAPDPSAVLYTGEPLQVNDDTLFRARTLDGGGWSRLAEAGYVTSLAPLVVTEVMYNPAVKPEDNFGASNFEFVELQNVGDVPVSLVGVELAAVGVTFDGMDVFGGELLTLAPGGYVVVVRNVEAFTARYGSDGIRIGSTFAAGKTLSNSEQELAVTGAFGEDLLRFRYLDDWQPTTDGGGYSLVILDPTAPRESWADGSSWRASSSIDGSPGRADPVPDSLQLPADINQDRKLDLSDPIALLAHLFRGIQSRPCATDEANDLLNDSNGDSTVDLADATYTLLHLFASGPPPTLGSGCVPIEGCPSLCE